MPSRVELHEHVRKKKPLRLRRQRGSGKVLGIKFRFRERIRIQQAKEGKRCPKHLRHYTDTKEQHHTCYSYCTVWTEGLV